MAEYTAVLRGTSEKLTVASDSTILKTTVEGGANLCSVDASLYFLDPHFEQEGEAQEGVGGFLNKPRNTRDTYNLVLQPVTLADFETYRSDLKNVIGSKYNYLEVTNYKWDVHLSTQCIGVVPMDTSIDSNSGNKDIVLGYTKVLPENYG